MKKIIIAFIAILSVLTTQAQVHQLRGNGLRLGGNGTQINQDDQQTVIDNRPKPPITDYAIISVKGDTTHVDTTLAIYKDYRFNYLRKDNFELLPFSNVGQSYTQLGRSFDEVYVMPKFGARSAHFAYLDVDDIQYYHVPTPWTELLFKTTFEQGQLLDAFFTSNLSPQFNFSVAYKGLHSLGKYRHLMTSQGSFRTTASYRSKNKRYQLNAHFVSQDLSAQQNGGLTDLSNRQFGSASGEYSDRAVLDVKFEDAEGFLLAKRFFVKHHYNLVQGDSTGNNQLRLGHIFNFSDQEYTYTQGKAYALFGTTYQNSNLNDLTEFQELDNTVYAQYQNNILGQLRFGLRHSHYNYGYKRKLYLQNSVIPNRLEGNVVTLTAAYQKQIGGFQLRGEAMLNTVGDFDGNYLKATASYALDSVNYVEASALTNSHAPNYNFLLYQSDYKNYNWATDFENVQKQQLKFALHAPKLVNLEASYTRLHNYAYFGLRDNPDPTAAADTLITPYQYDGDVSYVKLKANKEFIFGKHFAFNNTLMYQNVLDGKDVFKVSPFVTRNTIYFKDYWFQNNLYLQTGFTFNYFGSFYADGYDPVMAEYYVQNKQELEGFTRLDFFFNAKIRTARLFFKVENLTTLIDGNGHYAAPYQPYRDWSIRFGMVWDFFL